MLLAGLLFAVGGCSSGATKPTDAGNTAGNANNHCGIQVSGDAASGIGPASYDIVGFESPDDSVTASYTSVTSTSEVACLHHDRGDAGQETLEVFIDAAVTGKLEPLVPLMITQASAFDSITKFTQAELSYTIPGNGGWSCTASVRSNPKGTFSLSIDSAQIAADGTSYVVHGSAHGTCPSTNSIRTGVLTIDVTF